MLSESQWVFHGIWSAGVDVIFSRSLKESISSFNKGKFGLKNKTLGSGEKLSRLSARLKTVSPNRNASSFSIQ